MDGPIACSLDGQELRGRLAWLAKLRQDALIEARREDLRLELLFTADARERVEALVKQEKSCCSFLAFALEETPRGIRLTIEAPEEARFAADEILGYFAPAGAA